MRLKNGDKVEVQNNNDTPVSWRVAKILSSKGHRFRVQYDSCSVMENKQMVETVPRTLVRPCPPVVQSVKNCIAGDIVEVLCEFTWKMAAVLSVLKGTPGPRSKKISLRYLVRILGCSEEIVVDESNIRTRHIWHGNKWVLIEKNSRGGEDAITNKPSTSNFHQKMNVCDLQFHERAKKRRRNDYSNLQDKTPWPKSNLMDSRSPKMMAPYTSSMIEAHNMPAEKITMVKKDGKKQRVAPALVPEKVDAVFYPRETWGDKNMHASNFISTGCTQMERENLNSSSDSDDACSVGSCSVADRSLNNFFLPFKHSPWRETEALVSSDAESCYGSSSERKRSSFPLKGELEGNIHGLEMYAYRRTLEALYASGPLSWEQEALLTNLRITLHISNDEHLMVLRNLISSKLL